jgi:ribosomal protein S18 acetylase RimI-like enzyme
MTNGITEPVLDFRRMTSSERPEVFELLSNYFADDPFYRESAPAYRGGESGREEADAALAEALALFIDRPDYGFVWLAFEDGRVVGCAAVGYSISLSLGRVVASLDMLTVAPAARRRGVGVELVESLVAQLESAEVARLDVGVHERNDAGRKFYAGLGFEPTHETRMALVLA